MSGISRIAEGSRHTCALTTGGTVKCWGQNSAGQLGVFGGNSYVPVNVSGISGGIIDVRAGGLYTCALTSNEAVECWGDNTAGQLGNGNNITQYSPVYVLGFTGTTVPTPTNTPTNTPTFTPTPVVELLPGASVAAGSMHTCALTTDGGVRCWGMNNHGQLGNSTMTNSSISVDQMRAPRAGDCLPKS